MIIYNVTNGATFTMLPTFVFGKNTAGAHEETSTKYKTIFEH